MKLLSTICSASIFIMTTVSCSNSKSEVKDNKLPNTEHHTNNKFEPEDGKCYIFIGQDMGAIGGLPDYNDGYCDSFETPAGITVYFSLKPSTSNNGLFEMANWGSGDCFADFQANSDRFKDCMIAVGMSMVHQEDNILSGKCDQTLKLYGDWFKSLAPRPIFLRIGYEFDGVDWNFYKKDSYKASYKYVKDKLDSLGVDNVAFVWQSRGYGTSRTQLAEWYPGDEYVDWCAYSHFGQPDMNMIEFAELRKKPVFIAEATPIFQTGPNSYDEGKTTIAHQAQKMWSQWFIPFFARIEAHPCVKAISYINVDWYTQPMWVNNPTFQKVDSRLQKSPLLKEKWEEKMADKRYINLKEMHN